jgi:DNA-directed RNA polymerase specialized sigma24 family protein
LEYASAKDFCSIFHQDMDVLYWLALALTGDAGKAEQCFVAGLDECIQGNAVFKEWARSWSRRVVIKNAIRLISPRPDVTSSPRAIHEQEQPALHADGVLAALMNLNQFDRFVFVISVLEGYADRDCAALLGCSSTEVASARVRALQQLPREMEPSRTGLPGGVPEGSVTLSDVEVA